MKKGFAMLRYSFILLMLFLISCSTTKIVKKERSVDVRRVEVINKEPGVEKELDLTSIESRDWESEIVDNSKEWQTEIIDSTKIEIVVPKKVIYKPETQTIKIDKNTSVDIEITATLDSGKVKLGYGIEKIAYQESTVVEHIETDTSPQYIRWIIIIAILAFIAIIIIVLKLRK